VEHPLEGRDKATRQLAAAGGGWRLRVVMNSASSGVLIRLDHRMARPGSTRGDSPTMARDPARAATAPPAAWVNKDHLNTPPAHLAGSWPAARVPPRKAAERSLSHSDHRWAPGCGMAASSLRVQCQRAQYSAAVRASSAIVKSRCGKLEDGASAASWKTEPVRQVGRPSQCGKLEDGTSADTGLARHRVRNRPDTVPEPLVRSRGEPRSRAPIRPSKRGLA
jgi:hypothetical protein